jgi:membrane-associated phospholipid phosphatase
MPGSWSIRSRSALAGAAACVALIALDWLAAFHIRLFEHADQSIFLQFAHLYAHGRLEDVARHIVRLCDPNPYIYLALIPALVAAFRRRPRIVLAVAAIILGATVTTELIKHLLRQPRPGFLFVDGIAPLPPGSWPSGHSTAAMSLVLASVIAVPARLRPLVATLGGLFAIGVGYSLLAGGEHYPSDIFGGFLVATTWTLLAVAALRATDPRHAPGRRAADRVSIRAALGPTGAVLIAAVVLSLLVIIVRPHDVVSYARGHEAFVIGAVAIATLGLALSTGVALAVRR